MNPANDQILTQHIAAKLIEILPRSHEHTNCLDPGYVTAFLYACHFLERLGYVDATDGTKRLQDTPSNTQTRLRLDDAIHLLLLCLEECRLIRYMPLDREIVVALVESYGASEEDLDPEIDEAGWVTIAGGDHSCDANVYPSIVPTLQDIGLVTQHKWSDQAVPILWRMWINMNPTERPADTTLFQERLTEHFATMPTEIGEKLEGAVWFSEDLLARKQEMLDGQEDADEVRRLAGQSRLLELQFLFATKWRFSDGWLSVEQESECLFLGYDALAGEMAHTLVCQEYPESDLARALKSEGDVRGPLH